MTATCPELPLNGYYSGAEVVRILGTSRSTFNRLRREGILTPTPAGRYTSRQIVKAWKQKNLGL